MVHAREYATACPRVEPGVGVTAWDIDAMASSASFGPFDRDPVRRIFRTDAEPRGQALGADLCQSNQTDAGDGLVAHEVRLEGGR
jgi:hypothetical protein